MKGSVVVLVCAALLSYPMKVIHCKQDLYFTNLANIQLLRDDLSMPEVVIRNLELADALDCNICDSMIYWVDEVGKIKRATPDGDDLEVIIEKDLIKPIGISVDWKGSNVYFSDQRHTDTQGRVEVATCDGAHRKVLFHKLRKPGPLAVNVLTGHLYFTALTMYLEPSLYRSDLDGQNEELILTEVEAEEIVGMAIDVSTNILYYAYKDPYNGDGIKSIDLSQAPSSNYQGQPVSITSDGSPHGLSAANGTLFWTELLQTDENTGFLLRPGAIYSLHVNSGVLLKLFQNESINPHDVSSFPDFNVPHDDCAESNGGCEVFCFTVPDGNQGTLPRCGCPTGLIMRENNSCPEIPDNFLLFSQTLSNPHRSEIRLLSLDVPLSESVDVLVPVNISDSEISFIAFDITYYKLYWTETDPPAIKFSSLDGSDQAVFIDRNIRHPEGLAIDHLSRNLYWVDSSLDRIEVVTLDKAVPFRKTLFSHLNHPQGIALDLARGYVYWTDLHSIKPTVEWAYLNGSGSNQVPNVGKPVKSPTNIAVDPLTSRVYWTDVVNNQDQITVYETSDRQLTNIHLEDVLGLTVHGVFVYWTHQGSDFQLGRANKLNGNDEERVVDAVGLRALTAVDINIDYDNYTSCIGTEDCDICLPSGVFGACTCADNFELTVYPNTGTRECIDMEPRVFYAVDGTLRELDVSIDDTTVQWLISNELPQWNVAASAIAVDNSGKMIYWIDQTDQLIYRQSLDQSSVPEQIISCCVGSPEDLAVDWLGKNLYWTDSSHGTIEVAKLDGRGRYLLARNLNEPAMISLDPVRGNLYWSPKSEAKLYRLRMDGTSDQPYEIWSSPDPGRSIGIAIKFTSSRDDDVLYWTITEGTQAAIWNCELSSETPECTPSRLRSLENIKLKRMRLFQERLYLLEEFVIGDQVVYLDPSSTTNILNTALQVYEVPEMYSDFVIMHHSLQPGIHECAVNNRGCTGDGNVPHPLCLVRDDIYGVCTCPAHMAKRITTSNGLDVETCALVDDFLLIAVSDGIYYLPVPDPTISNFEPQSPKLLPIGAVGDVQAVAFDPLTNDVFWVDGETQQLYSAAVDGTSMRSIATIPNVSALSLAYDYENGHLFLTETLGFQIELFTVNGDGKGSLLPLTISSQLLSPRELAFDPVNFLLYWTNYGEELYTSSLHNLSDIHQIQLPGGERQIRSLTFDPVARTLFWVNQDAETVERYDTDAGTLEVVANNTGTIKGLTMIRVGRDDSQNIAGTPTLFWYDESYTSIYKYDEESGTQLLQEWALPGDIKGFQGFQRVKSVPTLPCLDNPRPCSHICERLSVGNTPNYQCSCPPYTTLNGTTCSDQVHCDSPLYHSCGDGLNCFIIGYHCDGIKHCRNGFDEDPNETCMCDSDTERRCNPNSHQCIPQSNWCDGTPDCLPGEEDEMDYSCPKCPENQFGCIVENGKFECLQPDLVCDEDGHEDCLNGEDESNCTTPSPFPSPTSPSTTKDSRSSESSTIVIVSIASVAFVFILVVIALFVCGTLRMIKRKQQFTLRPGHAASYKPSISPAPRSESLSEYSVGISSMTESTRVNMSPSTESTFKRWSATGLSTDPSNPPPSLCTPLRHSMTEFDDLSMATSYIPEYRYPPPPPPSVDYDALSGMSVSVSHKGEYSGALPINGRMDRHNMPSYTRPNVNPLMSSHQICRHNYYNNRPHPSHVHPQPPQSHNPYHHQHPPHSYLPHNIPSNGLYGNNHYQMHHRMHHNGGMPAMSQPDHADTEVESVFSVVTTQTENVQESGFHYNSINDVTPPGRPPSPATVTEVSVQRGPPMSPASPISEFSDDETFRSDVHSVKD